MKNEIIVSFDASLRSSGLMAVDLQGNIIRMTVIAPPPKKFEDEELLLEIQDKLEIFLLGLLRDGYVIRAFLYERAAFAANSSTKDKLAGSYWLNRIALWDLEIVPILVSVESWRKKVLSKEDRKRIREEKIKDGLKILVYNKLPYDVKCQIDNYVEENKLKKTAIYDLSDSYWMAQHGLEDLI